MSLRLIELCKKDPLSDRRLFDTTYQSVSANPDDIVTVHALDFVFAVFSAKLQSWLTDRRLAYARTGKEDLRNPK